MIALLLAGALYAAPDSTEFPFHVSAFAGPEFLKVKYLNSWFETSMQFEFKTIGMIRYGYSVPLLEERISTLPKAADLQRNSHTLSLAKEWRKASRWCAVGGGWSWMRLDTTAFYEDPRNLFIEGGNGLQLITKTTPGMWGSIESTDHIVWKWAVPVEKQSPYLFVEVGNGWELLSTGIRAEYRFGFGVGFFLRLRIPAISSTGASAGS